ncbi:hypothetical protein BCV69DRAFT_297976 [Microstroma glucosiphilum]|uniref:TRIP4/RQT4 C2HC5-type zinc finger domain-containing protein n=1 Tax=Pseudomicrostroma glucosiphilum TaxID=1684307 RepID=A0A316UAB7_9BASI|nr:hypothetical protein BCV69DRAFT_297976 [Pseudomicrostroma glucosiphilum]PWN21764.1 hypothetical protein BCV69DRAFT_297976 [Pseudomicrostroma glucosiphilum]
MVLSDQAAVQQIAGFTGLDNETVSTQILPYVKKLPDAQALRHHLIDLIGPGSAQTTFVKQLVDTQFPPPPPPQPVSHSKPTQSSGSSSNAKSGQSSSNAPVDLSKAFGSSGAVYVKDRGQKSYTPRSAARTPQEGLSRANTPLGTKTPPIGGVTTSSAGSSSHFGDKQHAAAPGQAPSSSQQPFQLAPSEEMKMLNDEIAELTGDGRESISAQNPKRKSRTCYCQGRVHPLFKRRPICLSCGLLLCSMNTPTPFSPDAGCPSCSTILLPPAERSALLSSLISQRDEAEQRALARVEHVRAERERAKEEKRAVASQELFPELSGGDAAARERARQLSIALGRKPRDDGGMRAVERKARVLTIGKKGKVTVGSTKKPAVAKSKQPATTSASAQAAQATGSQVEEDTEATHPQSDEDDDEAEAEELLRLGYVLDQDEDALHAGEDPESHRVPPEGVPGRAFFNPYLSWAGEEDTKEEKVRYLPPGERPTDDEVGDVEGDEDMEKEQGGKGSAEGAKGRAVPGAATSANGGKGRKRNKKKGGTDGA